LNADIFYCAAVLQLGNKFRNVFMVKWSGDSKCCLKDTESRTTGEAMPGQNTSRKM